MDMILAILTELRPEFDFHESGNFIEDGYLDSFDIVSLIAALEERFQISIDGLDIVPENFVSCDAIIHLVQKSGGKI